MLRREHLKQAIEAITRRDPEIGQVLDEMLGAGRIAPAAADALSRPGEDFYFSFDDHKATVRRGVFFDKGTAPIEERLLIRYGELLEKHNIEERLKPVDYSEAARQVRRAGLAFMVDHEVAHAAAQLDRQRPGFAALVKKYSDLKASPGPRIGSAEAWDMVRDAGASFQGTVATGKTAFFIPFPLCREALIQVADLNVEFFHIRFLLACLDRDVVRNLFACVVDNRIQGLVYLTFREKIFSRALEIHYIATVRGRPEPGARPLKGVGTFLVAGVWMLWKTFFPESRELLLDSEAGARHFYAALGFQPRGLSGFVMKKPAGGLLKVLVEMAGDGSGLPVSAQSEIIRGINRQIDLLRKKHKTVKKKQSRALALDLLQTCLRPDAAPVITEAATRRLRRYRNKIPEAKTLLRPAETEDEQ